MTLTCSKCSRINPADAIYCYYDGSALDGEGRTGPIAMGSQPFVGPFVFASGRSCRSFDELAMACEENWDEAAKALQDGFLGQFFGGIGRADLAQTAIEAAKYPDVDRGLDQVLAQLPSDVLEEPKLQLSTREMNLGQLKVGEGRKIELELENLGMRLLYGSASCVDTPWISLGEGSGVEEKIFQFRDDFKLPIHINGDKLRAGNQPLEGKLVFDTNGGRETVVFRAEVPVTPFPNGVLAGAKTPRQIAEKARDNPKVAGQHFENNEVSEWYKSNGWTYPVQGPASSGLSAVQQFFEALGLTPPPKVRISTKSLEFSGSPGQQGLEQQIEIGTKEKKPVYAHGTSNQDWIQVERATLTGRIAKIVVKIPSVPVRPGETLTGKVTVQSNGNQRFVLPVSLTIDHNMELAPAAPEPTGGSPFDFDGSSDTGGSPFDFDAPAPAAQTPQVLEEPAAVPQVLEAVEEDAEEPVAVLEAVEEPVAAPAAPPPPSIPQPRAATSGRSQREEAGRRPVPPSRQQGMPTWLHSIPAVVLVLILVTMSIIDLATDAGKGGTEESATLTKDPKTGAFILSNLVEPKVPLAVDFNPEKRFGLVMRYEKDPTNANQLKKLTSDAQGINNNTVVKVDGKEHLYGKRPGQWVRKKSFTLPAARNQYGQIVQMRWIRDKVLVTQHVQLLPGETGTLDTCLVLYRVKNEDASLPHKVGLRVMLDTLIGSNDGVPFLIPGEEDLVTSMRTIKGKESIPAYLEAIENPNDEKNAGTVARVGLKGISLPGTPSLTPLDKIVVCAFPGNANIRWDWEPSPMNRSKDSCVALYWDEQELAAGEERYYGFTYGLSDLDFSGESKLVLSVPSNVYEGAEFIVTAYVYDARDNQNVTLELPEGFQLAAGESARKSVQKGGKRATVNWKVIAPKDKKTFKIRARSGGEGATIQLVIKGETIFG